MMKLSKDYNLSNKFIKNRYLQYRTLIKKPFRMYLISYKYSFKI